MNNYLGGGGLFCIWFWENENNILVLFGFYIGNFFLATRIVCF
jgi:hypothetical protein